MSPTLAFVFWHVPQGSVGRKEYERRLLGFLASMKSHPPEGLIDASSFRLGCAPWSTRRRTTYEDWYLVEGFQSLGTLNEGAVAAANRRPHDDVAKEAGEGHGGVYRLIRGVPKMEEARFATWVRKPRGTSYADFFDRLAGLAGAALTDAWQRQLTLGPAPEFCIHSRAPIRLPRTLKPASIPLQPVRESSS